MIHIYFREPHEVYVVRYDLGTQDHARLDFESFMALADLRATWAERGSK